VVFLKAQGVNINSAQSVDEATAKAAGTIIKTAEKFKIKPLVAVDFKVADRDVSKENKIPEGVKTYQLTVEQLSQPFFTDPATGNQIATNKLYIYDLGDKSVSNIVAAVRGMPKGSTSVWNGNTGVDFLENSSFAIAKALDIAKDENGVDSMMAGGTTSELASRINPQLKNKIMTSKGGSSALTAMQDGSIPVTDNMEAVWKITQYKASVAQKIGVSYKEMQKYIDSEETVSGVQGLGAFRNFVSAVSNSLQEARVGEQAKALIVAPEFFKLGGAKNAINMLLPLSRVIKIGIYGDSAESMAELFAYGVTTGKTLEEVQAKLTKGGVALKDMMITRSPKDTILETTLVSLSENKAKQITAKDMTPVAIAKAIAELLDTSAVSEAFNSYYQQLAKDNVISEQVYSGTKDNMAAKIEGLALDMPEAIKPVISKDVALKVETAKQEIVNFMDKV